MPNEGSHIDGQGNGDAELPSKLSPEDFQALDALDIDFTETPTATEPEPEPEEEVKESAQKSTRKDNFTAWKT